MSWTDVVDVVNKSSKKISEATHALNADNATNTDFTNAEWIEVTDAETGATGLVEGATYEVVSYVEGTVFGATPNACGIITLLDVHTSVPLNTNISVPSSTDKILRFVYDYISQQSKTRIVVVRELANIGFNSSGNGITKAEQIEEFLKFKYRRIR